MDKVRNRIAFSLVIAALIMAITAQMDADRHRKVRKRYKKRTYFLTLFKSFAICARPNCNHIGCRIKGILILI